ncbi:uncharacterized protein TRAVEDRAFT_52572 [Trametes versicolor FP-101664 SS1]|uniref:uncharacterized protein n=1 Tax=Trametes versicolor (strain FP-101664) TaxID=717944 RepID=UPI000462200D|nr:uncharacterized protein TRAVEDRAFT_52572 [Trametes versicolor FP-101664 SS1]EIW53443.1 hypothetical protein TRAVEDRAFT_52572 [Trametes versicolor FP-101664 SS1]
MSSSTPTLGSESPAFSSFEDYASGDMLGRSTTPPPPSSPFADNRSPTLPSTSPPARKRARSDSPPLKEIGSGGSGPRTPKRRRRSAGIIGQECWVRSWEGQCLCILCESERADAEMDREFARIRASYNAYRTPSLSPRLTLEDSNTLASIASLLKSPEPPVPQSLAASPVL